LSILLHHIISQVFGFSFNNFLIFSNSSFNLSIFLLSLFSFLFSIFNCSFILFHFLINLFFNQLLDFFSNFFQIAAFFVFASSLISIKLTNHSNFSFELVQCILFTASLNFILSLSIVVFFSRIFALAVSIAVL
jgi:hypothetical protein